MDVWRPVGLSATGSTAAVVSVGVICSTGAFSLSFEGCATAGWSVTDSGTADNFGGDLREMKEGIIKRKRGREAAR